MNLIETYEKGEIGRLIKEKEIPDFRVGNTVVVSVKVKEGNRERKQDFQGVVIAKHNRALGSTFRVRKMAFGEAIERVFHTYSPNISVKVKRIGKVRRAKLYYLRDRKGKKAVIPEKR